MNSIATVVWRRIWRRLGPMGLGGLGVLAAAVALALWLPSLKHEADKLAARVAVAAVAPAAAPRQSVSDRQQARQFTAAFPPLSQNAEDVSRLFELAEKRKIKLPKGEYQLASTAGSPFVTYTVTFPVKETYVLLKDYASEVLSELPHASMDDLRLERSDASARELDARIRFTLIYRGS